MISGLIALLTALPALLSALPYLLQLTLKMISIVEKFISWTKTKEFNAWIDHLEVTFDKIEDADTPEKKRGAARDLVDLIRKLK